LAEAKTKPTTTTEVKILVPDHQPMVALVGQADELLKLVKKKEKQRGNVVRVEPEADTDHKVIDLVQVLKKSLAGKK